jgi:hypothetical protein
MSGNLPARSPGTRLASAWHEQHTTDEVAAALDEKRQCRLAWKVAASGDERPFIDASLALSDSERREPGLR